MDADYDFSYSDHDDASASYAAAELEKGQEKSYKVLKEEDVLELIDDDAIKLSTILSTTKSQASILLRHHNWNLAKILEDWVTDEPGVCKRIGLITCEPTATGTGPMGLTCGICFESCPVDLIRSAGCGHPFCADCWKGYISSNVDGGQRILTLRCPEPSCEIAVGDGLIIELASEEDIGKYKNCLTRSYVEENKNRKWCPYPDCNYAIEFPAGGGKNFDVICECRHSFCWNCQSERHRPVPCEMVEKWNLKNSTESLNETWKKVNTKPCPNCDTAIQKHRGCMHMTCRCGHQFCWICLKDYPCGGCNPYRKTESTKERESSKQELKKYRHYYERWEANERSMRIAQKDLEELKNNHIEMIKSIHGMGNSGVGFLIDAWEQVIECRRVLKWTYAYGFFLLQNETSKKQFFEFSQKHAESSLERLHDFVERKVNAFLKDSCSHDVFSYFRRKLIDLTKTTGYYFETLVRALENELSDVTSTKKRKAPMQMSSEDRQKTSSRGTCLPKNNQGITWECERCTFFNPEDAETCEMCQMGAWSCHYCTYANPRSSTTCQMCAIARNDRV